MIYYLQPFSGGLIKIGFTSKEVKQRVAELQTGCPDKLVVLATHEGGEKQEAELHQKFSDLRTIGEWFRPDARLLRHIFSTETDIDVVRLSEHAKAYGSCLWSHCVGDDVNQPLVDLLYQHAHYVAENTNECWQFLKDRGVKEVHWKNCQYFFALCWPIHRPWMELNQHVLKQLLKDGRIPSILPIADMYDDFRAITQPRIVHRII